MAENNIHVRQTSKIRTDGDIKKTNNNNLQIIVYNDKFQIDCTTIRTKKKKEKKVFCNNHFND